MWHFKLWLTFSVHRDIPGNKYYCSAPSSLALANLLLASIRIASILCPGCHRIRAPSPHMLYRLKVTFWLGHLVRKARVEPWLPLNIIFPVTTITATNECWNLACLRQCTLLGVVCFIIHFTLLPLLPPAPLLLP